MIVDSVIFPDGTISQTIRGCVELGDELLERGRADGAMVLGGADGVGVGVERDDLVVRVALDPMDHVAAHLPEADESDLHV